MTHPLTVHDTAAAGFPRSDPDSDPDFDPAVGTDLGHRDPAARPDADAGMSTVEYAVGTVVAAAFAAVLYRIVTGDSIVAGLTNLVQSALNTGF